MWCYRRMEKIIWPEKVRNEQVLELLGEKGTLLNNILCRKVNWIGNILRRDFLPHDTIEGQMAKMTRLGRRSTRLLDDLRNRRRYCELKLKIEKGGNDNLPHERKEEVQAAFHELMDLLKIRILNNNNNNNNKLTPWLTEPGASMPHSQGLSNNSYPEPNQSIPRIDTYFFKVCFNIVLPSTSRPS